MSQHLIMNRRRTSGRSGVAAAGSGIAWLQCRFIRRPGSRTFYETVQIMTFYESINALDRQHPIQIDAVFAHAVPDRNAIDTENTRGLGLVAAGLLQGLDQFLLLAIVFAARGPLDIAESAIRTEGG